MLILDGKIAAAAVKATLLEQTQALKAAGKRTPHLAAILVGSNGASETYVASKVKNCEETGFGSSLYRFDADVEEAVGNNCKVRIGSFRYFFAYFNV